jgi:hypothetical protein
MCCNAGLLSTQTWPEENCSANGIRKASKSCQCKLQLSATLQLAQRHFSLLRSGPEKVLLPTTLLPEQTRKEDTTVFIPNV